MIIACFRCGKEIDTPDSSKADYIMAEDTIAREPREVLIALKQNQVTLAKEAKIREVDPDGSPKYPDLVIDDNEYDAVEIPSLEVGRQSFGEDLAKVVVEVREKDIQKTGIICPDCHRDTDFVIWGVHKAHISSPQGTGDKTIRGVLDG